MDDPASGTLPGVISDFQVQKVRELVAAAGQSFELVDAADAAHSLHQADPERFAGILTAWAERLPAD